MDIKTLRIVYMGTPEFAVAPLETLVEAQCNVVAVVTTPDKPAGRGKKIRYSAVKQFAATHDLHILQPTNLKDPGFVQSLQELKPDLQVVVAFRMLPELVWRIPVQGTFNLHASLLPQYRGAAPINHVILNGETSTGVTTFMIDEQIDTGSILLQDETNIGDRETAGELHDRLMALGAQLVLETVNQLAADDLKAQSQENFINHLTALKKAPKIYKEDCRIDWNLPGRVVYNLIRGLSPYPGAFTYLSRAEGEKILCKLFSSAFKAAQQHESPGTIQSDGKKYLKVAVKDGYINIHSIQQEGKRRMDTAAFLAGISLTSGQPRFS
ncbi:MAG: methionyl-tRNA formyltransferase [Bacteroidales bacterium]|nr:methionyl-tRNA formyltransferase [Bacteroidales bacterium]